MAAVVLNYREVEDTLRCLHSLRRGVQRAPDDVVVVDNSADAAVADALRRRLPPDVALVVAPDNLGYAGGNNLGLRYVLPRGADLAWVLNPDAVVEPETLRRLVETARTEPRVGVLGPRILHGGTDPARIWYDGAVVDPARGGATWHLHHDRTEDAVPDLRLRDTGYVTGAAMLVRRQVLDEVGLLPEEWFLYYEETDFCLRARAAGWRVCVLPAARMWHFKRSTGDVPTPYYLYYIVRNRITFGRKHFGADPDTVVADLQAFLRTWRDKVTAAAPDWLPTYDLLIERAIADGRAGVQGRRADIETIPVAVPAGLAPTGGPS